MPTGINYISKGNGIAFVFQHGLTASIRQAEALFSGAPGIRLLAIDCPGHGASPLAENYSPSFSQYADEVIALLDKLEVKQAVFGGISMGSGIAVNIALRYPERTLGLFLVRPAWLDWTNPENLQVLLPAAELIGKPNGKEEFSLSDQFKQIEPAAAAQSVLGVFSPEQQPTLLRVIRAMVGDRPFENLDQLDQLNIPTIVIGNDHDPLHPFDMAEKISQSIPGSVLRKVTSRYIDDPKHSEQLRALLKEFIKDNILQ